MKAAIIAGFPRITAIAPLLVLTFTTYHFS